MQHLYTENMTFKIWSMNVYLPILASIIMNQVKFTQDMVLCSLQGTILLYKEKWYLNQRNHNIRIYNKSWKSRNPRSGQFMRIEDTKQIRDEEEFVGKGGNTNTFKT